MPALRPLSVPKRTASTKNWWRSSPPARSSWKTWSATMTLGRSFCPSTPNSFPLTRKSSRSPWICLPLRRDYRIYSKCDICNVILPGISHIFVCFSYKSREEFCADVRQIFNNCETFNEDDSPVGKAGHCMRQFFEARWNELCTSHSWGLLYSKRHYSCRARPPENSV